MLFRSIEPLLNNLSEGDRAVSLVDHGAGKSYLGFILYDLFFKSQPALKDSRIYGIETRAELVQKSTELAQRLGFPGMEFLHLSVADSVTSDKLPETVDIVTALHACDTATDDAIAWCIRSGAQLALIAPCCHHDIQAQMHEIPEPWSLLTRNGIMKERLGDLLTDALRMQIMKLRGYRVEAIEFVAGVHTPRNLMIRAIKTGAAADAAEQKRYDEMIALWKVKPALTSLLNH